MYNEQVGTKAVRVPGTGVTGICEAIDVGARH